MMMLFPSSLIVMLSPAVMDEDLEWRFGSIGNKEVWKRSEERGDVSVVVQWWCMDVYGARLAFIKDLLVLYADSMNEL